MSNSIEARTCQLKTNRFFVILTLTGHQSNLDTIWEHSLTGLVVPSLDKVFAQPLYISSTLTRPLHNYAQDPFVMVAWTNSLTVYIMVIKADENILSAHAATSLATHVIVAINYIDDLHTLLLWLHPLILHNLNQKLKVKIHPYIRESSYNQRVWGLSRPQ